jgi:hypothetical protein
LQPRNGERFRNVLHPSFERAGDYEVYGDVEKAMRFIPSKLNSAVLVSGLPDLLVDPRCGSRAKEMVSITISCHDLRPYARDER